MKQYNRWNPDRNARPVMEGQSAVTVEYGMSLIDILDMDENDVATLVLWENYEWKDPTLAWNRSQYPSNPQSIRVDLDNIWHPDIMPFNLIDSDETLRETHAVVYSGGTVSYVAPIKRKIHCSQDEEAYLCTQKLGSWTYDGSQLNVQLSWKEDIDTSIYRANPHLELLETSAKRNVNLYECCPEPWISLTFEIKLRKHD